MRNRKPENIFILALFALILCFFGFPACADAMDVKAGETFYADFVISENPDEAVSIMYELKYDHQAFELYPPTGIQNEKGILERETPFAAGEKLTVYFRALEAAAAGNYQIQMVVNQAVKADYSMAGSMKIEPVEINVQAISTQETVNVSVGDHLVFGHYEQDNNQNNGLEPIEWIVLDVQEGKSLLISRYGLDVIPYNREYTESTWENCTLRSWLNDTFLNGAFTDKEKAAILPTQVDNSGNQGYLGWGLYEGKSTEDLVFLLSYQEAFRVYFPEKQERMCAPTSYAIVKGAITNINDKTDGRAAGPWLLRSPGFSRYTAAGVDTSGARTSFNVDASDGCIRPVLWIDLKSDVF